MSMIEDSLRATSEIAKTTLRSVLGKAELDTLLSERERLNEDLQRIILLPLPLEIIGSAMRAVAPEARGNGAAVARSGAS